ncbi:hypothetical protein M8818_002377 [Zalaria obscura]|uniref:Uncharacterized protein n=1 Tax=Zalaria obscura TaxID=2024903 RepID=A0ACC3SHL6_9PEZI
MLRKTVDQALEEIMASDDTALLVEEPLGLHILLATLSLEAYEYHMRRFQRFMWAQFNKVDDHFYGSAIKKRQSLGLLTKDLRIVTYNAASHIANIETATINATAIKNMHQLIIFHSAAARVSNNTSRLNHIPPKQSHSQDVICYVLDSMGKQKMWFENYKHRKDTTMSLVFNLVTQQDAANNISIVQEMKKNSSSMNAIAALTMFFRQSETARKSTNSHAEFPPIYIS